MFGWCHDPTCPGRTRQTLPPADASPEAPPADATSEVPPTFEDAISDEISPEMSRESKPVSISPEFINITSRINSWFYAEKK